MKINSETKVGILAALAVTMLILGFNFLKGDQIFSKSFELNAYYDNIDNLTQGNPVIFNGLKVGQVKEIQINKQTGRIKVGFSVDRGLAIPINSTAEIISSDLLGSKAIRINRGENETRMAESGYPLKGIVQQSLGEQVQDEVLPVKDKLEEVIDQFAVFMGKLNNTFDENNSNKIDDMIDNLNTTSKNIAGASYRVDTMFRRVDGITANIGAITRNFKNQNAAIERILNNSATFSDSLAVASKDIKGFVEKANSAVDNLQGTLEKIENGDGSINKLLDDEGELYEELTTTVEGIDSLVRNPKVKVVLALGKSDARLRREAERDSIKAAQQALKEAEKEAKKLEKEREKAAKKAARDKEKEEKYNEVPEENTKEKQEE